MRADDIVPRAVEDASFLERYLAVAVKTFSYRLKGIGKKHEFILFVSVLNKIVRAFIVREVGIRAATLQQTVARQSGSIVGNAPQLRCIMIQTRFQSVWNNIILRLGNYGNMQHQHRKLKPSVHIMEIKYFYG